MKRLKSSDDLEQFEEKGVLKDWGRREEGGSGLHRSSSSSLHRSPYHKSSDSGRKFQSSSASRYDRVEEDRESPRLVRKRSDYDVENYDRRKSYDRQRDGKERGISSSSPRPMYGMDRMHRSESFSGPRRDIPKGFRSERERSRRDNSVTSWRRFGSGKDGDDGARSGSEMERGNKMEVEEVGKAKSPQAFRDAKSPAWSKDSESEQSKSIELKRYEDVSVESGGPSSEREEGELEPDPQSPEPLTESAVNDKPGTKLDLSQKELKSKSHVEEEVRPDKENFLSVEKGDAVENGSNEEQAESGPSQASHGVAKENKDSAECQDNPVADVDGCADQNETIGETVDAKNMMGSMKEEEDADGTSGDNLSSLQAQRKSKGTDLDAKDGRMAMSGNGIVDGKEMPFTEENTQKNWKDKGKNIAMSPSIDVHIVETNLEIENIPKEFVRSGDIEMDGPSTRGFQFLSSDPIKKQDKAEQSAFTKPKDDKLELDLSLSLPNVLLPIGHQNRGQAPGSPSHAGSVQSLASSFRTNSEGFTMSMSFSGSQQFTHNPSCSLTHNGHDFEQSVGSKPLFQGVDWKALAADENKNEENQPYQGMTSRGNGFHQQSQISLGNSSSQAVVQHLKVTGGSSKPPIGLERQFSFNNHSSGKQRVISYENGSESCRDSRQVIARKDSGGSKRINVLDGKEQVAVVGTDFAESIITMIVSEPLPTMARRFNEMNEQHVACIKEFVRDIITNPGKQWQLSALQRALRKRSDTVEVLTNAHHIQLEILLALKTGLQEFLLQKRDLRSSDLAEIFLNMRCRNLACRSLLPVDECDCKICAQRTGFCRECMCLVCSKFDNASNTCSWVGCDVCLHWCHADCGLRESYIRNGRSPTGAQGTTEMQFHCVACGHPSEMFGFVKEVFQNFLKEWREENLSRELEYVRKIFSASDDARGKHLHEIAIQMMSKLSNKANIQEVKNHVMSFFIETDMAKPGNFSIESRKELPTKDQERNIDFAGSSHGAGWMKSAFSDKVTTPLEHSVNVPLVSELPTKYQERSNGVAASSQGPAWMKSAYPDKSTPVENSLNILPGFDNKYTMNLDFRSNSQKEPLFDELESIVRIKHAEAKMFQTRADDARREADALKTISITKNERIEEEYSSRIKKLRLTEAEEMRRQKIEELQDLERAYHEYFSMKMRMETDIKDLLLKMEATRRNLST